MSDEVHGVERRMEEREQEHYLRMGDAARRVGISRTKMWSMVKRGEVESAPDLLDRRVTLIPVREVERLLRQSLRAQRVAVA